MIFPKGNSSYHLERMGEFLQSVVKHPLKIELRQNLTNDFPLSHLHKDSFGGYNKATMQAGFDRAQKAECEKQNVKSKLQETNCEAPKPDLWQATRK